MSTEATTESAEDQALRRASEETDYYMAALHELGYDKSRLKMLKALVPESAKLQDYLYLATKAKEYDLDPLSREIMLSRTWDKEKNAYHHHLIIGIEGQRRIADRTGEYCPGRETEYRYKEDTGELLSATVYVLRYHAKSGAWHEIAETAFYDEYVVKRKDGRPNQFWERMPKSQLAKCAEARALRRGFPDKLGGTYAPDELPDYTEEHGERQQSKASAGEKATGSVEAKLNKARGVKNED